MKHLLVLILTLHISACDALLLGVVASQDGGITLGDEINPDPNFDTPATWFTQDGASVSGGEAIFTGSSNQVVGVLSNEGIEDDASYQVTYEVTNTNNVDFNIILGGDSTKSKTMLVTSAIGTHTVTITVDDDTDPLVAGAFFLSNQGTSFNGRVSSLSIRKIL